MPNQRINLFTTTVQSFEESIDLGQYEVVGFHATSSLASAEIEQVGFLPHKILEHDDHKRILSVAIGLGLDVGSYVEWLEMRSVTFTKLLSQAVRHALEGRAGGQGLINVERLLSPSI